MHEFVFIKGKLDPPPVGVNSPLIGIRSIIISRYQYQIKVLLVVKWVKMRLVEAEKEAVLGICGV